MTKQVGLNIEECKICMETIGGNGKLSSIKCLNCLLIYYFFILFPPFKF